ncbi:MAG: hypothetical protein EZS28_011171 [Streblomastix strix]|uniref:Uncharacterized protein n=1 Tax=Streblomastix strix TaxID=222440 RepID=A0A5J4WF16_9EUKA|nr:MAG: hypothetical protein EZS28_011171 [Streblomastix strix]
MTQKEIRKLHSLQKKVRTVARLVKVDKNTVSFQFEKQEIKIVHKISKGLGRHTVIISKVREKDKNPLAQKSASSAKVLKRTIRNKLYLPTLRKTMLQRVRRGKRFVEMVAQMLDDASICVTLGRTLSLRLNTLVQTARLVQLVCKRLNKFANQSAIETIRRNKYNDDEEEEDDDDNNFNQDKGQNQKEQQYALRPGWKFLQIINTQMNKKTFLN